MRRRKQSAIYGPKLATQRKYVGFALFFLLVGGGYYTFFSGGLPILWGPSASAAEIAAGKELFEHEWQPNDPLAHGDGLGPVFNAKSCAACHFQGGLGGGGAKEHNALGYEVQPRPGDLTFHTGTVHNFSTTPALKESLSLVKQTFPTVKGKTIPAPPAPPGHCGYNPGPTVIPDFDPVATDSVQPTALFGAGWIDLISTSAIRYNQRSRAVNSTVRELKMEFDAVPVGRLRILADGRVGRFGWKAQFATLDEFVAAACANELGLGTPDREQAKPLTAPNHTAEPDLDRKQFRTMVAFVKTLPCPVEDQPEVNARGKELFTEIGCAACHVPDMGGVKGMYSDFLLYSLDDPAPPGGGGGGQNYDRDPPAALNLPTRPDSEPKPSEWRTPPLWGVGDSAPYLHDGSAATLKDAIARHNGDAKTVTEKFRGLPQGDQTALLTFLKSLKAPPTATPLRDTSVTKLARK